jgi:hypothetical protein
MFEVLARKYADNLLSTKPTEVSGPIEGQFHVAERMKLRKFHPEQLPATPEKWGACIS